MLIFSVSLAFSLAHHANDSVVYVFGISAPSAIILLSYVAFSDDISLAVSWFLRL